MYVYINNSYVVIVRGLLNVAYDLPPKLAFTFSVTIHCIILSYVYLMMRCLSVFSILELIMLIIKSYISKAITYTLQSYIVPDTLFLYFVSSKTVLSIAIHNKRRYIQNKDWKLNGAEARDVDWRNDLYVSFNTLFCHWKL